MAEDTPPTAETSEATEEVNTLTLVQWCISVLASNAWQRMGLIPNPTTKKIERNLDEARLAIDAAHALGDQVRPQLSEADRRQLETVLNDLRVNFLQQKDRP